jgi:GNAT superfamily N-acetyltransferase
MWVGPDDFGRYLQIENETRDEVESLTDDRGARYRAFWEWIEAALPDERQWFLDHLAVDERGRGIGSALVRFGLDRAARDGVIATLETGSPRERPDLRTPRLPHVPRDRCARRRPAHVVHACRPRVTATAPG